MKYIKYFENIDIDPFQEEDWDEEELGAHFCITKKEGNKGVKFFACYKNDSNRLFLLGVGSIFINGFSFEFFNFNGDNIDEKDAEEIRNGAGILVYDNDKEEFISMTLEEISDLLSINLSDIKLN